MRMWLIGLLATGLVACGDDEHEHEHGHSEALDAHPCLHVESGPVAAVDATLDAADAPESWQAHHRIDITLAEQDDGMFGGYVAFTAGSTGPHRFLWTADVPVDLRTADDMDFGFPLSADPQGCDAATAVNAAPLSEGVTYLLVFGPTETETVSMVARPLSKEEHDAQHAQAQGH